MHDHDEPFKDTGYSNDIAEAIATLGGKTWASKVKAALFYEDTSTTEKSKHTNSTITDRGIFFIE